MSEPIEIDNLKMLEGHKIKDPRQAESAQSGDTIVLNRTNGNKGAVDLLIMKDGDSLVAKHLPTGRVVMAPWAHVRWALPVKVEKPAAKVAGGGK